MKTIKTNFTPPPKFNINLGFVTYFCLFFLLSVSAFAQVGINVSDREPQATLEIIKKPTDPATKTQGILIPKMTTDERNAMASVYEGLMIYNTTLHCIQIYNGSTWSCADGTNISQHGSSAPSPANLVLRSLVFNSAATWMKARTMNSDNYITVNIENTGGTASSSLDLSNALSLANLSGISVIANQNNAVSIAGNSTEAVKYKLEGTSPNTGTLKASFSHTGVSGTQSTNQTFSDFGTGPGSGTVAVNSMQVNGTFVRNQPTTPHNTVKVVLKNDNSYPLNNLDLSNAVSINKGLGINGTSNNSVSIPANGSTELTYAIIGTPNAAGQGTATFSATSFPTQTANFEVWAVAPAAVTLKPIDDFYFFAFQYSGSTWNKGINSGQQRQIKLAYKNASPANGSYQAFNQTVQLPKVGGGTHPIKLYFPSGTFSGTNGVITAYLKNEQATDYKPPVQGIEQQITLGTYSVNLNGSQQNLVVKATGGIPDKSYDRQTNGQYEHKFVYVPLRVKIGNYDKTWLSFNLGADYANVDSPHFDPTYVPTSNKDYKAYGSLFIWGADTDGYELVTRSGSSDSDVHFKNNNNSYTPYSDYRTFDYEPCPNGYHTPTKDEWLAVQNAMVGQNTQVGSYYNNPYLNNNNPNSMRLQLAGYGDYETDFGAFMGFKNTGKTMSYMVSDTGIDPYTNSNSAFSFYFYGNNADIQFTNRRGNSSIGSHKDLEDYEEEWNHMMCIRCIKD